MYAPPEHLKYLPAILCGFKVPTHPFAADSWGVGMLTAEVRPLLLPRGCRCAAARILLDCGKPTCWQCRHCA